ncbi:MAG: YabP/YqfC family sporulation protein [Clostridia bacterium]|nr:YabP/YqfC family sporulation protein [Clostridia bacterium]
MKKRRQRLTKSISEKTDIPENVFPFSSIINIIQNSEISVENCKAILLYEENEIRLRTACFVLCIKGDELTLKSYFGSHITVKGIIRELHLEE